MTTFQSRPSGRAHHCVMHCWPHLPRAVCVRWATSRCGRRTAPGRALPTPHGSSAPDSEPASNPQATPVAVCLSHPAARIDLRPRPPRSHDRQPATQCEIRVNVKRMTLEGTGCIRMAVFGPRAIDRAAVVTPRRWLATLGWLASLRGLWSEGGEVDDDQRKR